MIFNGICPSSRLNTLMYTTFIEYMQIKITHFIKEQK